MALGAGAVVTGTAPLLAASVPRVHSPSRSGASEEAMTTQPPELDYAPHLPPWHRRSFVRRVIGSLILVLVVVSSLKLGPLLWRQVTLLYWQHQRMIYAA